MVAVRKGETTMTHPLDELIAPMSDEDYRELLFYWDVCFGINGKKENRE